MRISSGNSVYDSPTTKQRFDCMLCSSSRLSAEGGGGVLAFEFHTWEGEGKNAVLAKAQIDFSVQFPPL
jgi:hypothetical protein